MVSAPWRRASEVTAPDGRVWVVDRRWLPRAPRWRGWGFRHSRRAKQLAAARAEAEAREEAARAATAGEVVKPEPEGKWRRRWRRAGDSFTIPDPPIDDPGCLLALLAVVVAAVLAWFVVLPLLFLFVDVAVVVLIALVGAATRVLFRRPWKIVAHTDGPPPGSHAWGVIGFRASGAAPALIARELERGVAVERIRPANLRPPAG